MKVEPPAPRSGIPSAAQITDHNREGRSRGGEVIFAPKLPVPVPSSIDTAANPALATARSCLPSLLRSETATAFGAKAVAKLAGAANVPDPVPIKTDTSLVPPLAVTRSTMPSSLKSPS